MLYVSQALAAQFKEQEDSANRRAAEEKAKQKELKAKYAPKGLLQKQAQVELAKASAALKQVKQAEAVAGHHTDATSGTPSKPAGTCVVAGAGAGARPAPKPAPGQATKPALYNRRMASSQPARAHKPEVGLPRKPAVPRVAECRATSATRGVPHSSEYGARPESAPPSPTRWGVPVLGMAMLAPARTQSTLACSGGCERALIVRHSLDKLSCL